MKVRFAVSVVSLLVIATPAQAATFVVTKTSDSFDGACNADCSLREAVQAADADATADEIVLPAGVLQLELLPAGEDNSGESGDLDVTGDLTIRGQGADATTVRSTINTRVLSAVGPGTDLSLRDLTVAGGHPPLDEEGGGIRATGSGELSLERAIIRDNVVVGSTLGYGGGILKAGGRLTVRDSAILGNRAEGSGYGGGILLTDASTSANLTNVTIAENLANKGGGGVYFNNAIAANFVNVTIVNNKANEFGGGLAVDLSLARLRSSIVAANVAPSGADCSSPGPASDGGNIGPAACGFTLPTDLNPADPGLGPLSASGIPVLEPLPGSPAIDHAVGSCSATDARGIPRPQGPACDSGAAELPVPAVPQPGLLRLPRRLKLRGTRVAVPLRCAAGPACEGNLSLTAARRGGKASAMGRPLLAVKAFAIDGGKRKIVKARLTRTGRRVARGRHVVRATLSVSLTGVQGAQTEKVRIVRARRKHHG